MHTSKMTSHQDQGQNATSHVPRARHTEDGTAAGSQHVPGARRMEDGTAAGSEHVPRAQSTEDGTASGNQHTPGAQSREDGTAAGSQHVPLTVRVLKTCCMLAMYTVLGCMMGVPYATLVDMVEYYAVSYQSVTVAQMVKALGIISGFVFGTPITDRFRSKVDLFLFIFAVLFGVTSAAIPWAPNITCVGLLFYANGLCHSTFNICCVTMCVVMWGARAPAPIFGLYTCITVGITVAPLLAAPFLSRPLHPHNGTTAAHDPRDSTPTGAFLHYVTHAYRLQQRNYLFLSEAITPLYITASATDKGYNSTDGYVLEGGYSDQQLQHRAPNMTETHMQVPYAITGICAIFIGFIFLGFYIFTTAIQSTNGPSKRRIKDMINPGSCANGSKWFGLYCTLSLLVCYIFSNGRDRGFGMFVFTVANKGLDVNKNTAALIMFSYNATGAIARALCALLSLFVPIQIITLILILGAVIVQVIMLFYALHSVTYFWVLCCAMSVFIGPVYPSMLGWVERYIEVNGVVMAVIQVGIGTGGLSGMFLTNYVFQRYHVQAVMDLALVYGAGLALVFIPLQIVAHARGTRDQRRDYQRLSEQEDGDVTNGDIKTDAHYSINTTLEPHSTTSNHNGMG